MKTDFITTLAGCFIEKEYFNVIGNDQDLLDFSRGTASLYKHFQGMTVILEIIDGDKLNIEQTRLFMEHGLDSLNNLSMNNATIFKLFLYDSEPELEKLDVIIRGQIDIPEEKKFLKAYSLNIAEGSITKHFNYPTFDAKIERTVRNFFSKKLDVKSADTEEIKELLEKRKSDMDIEIKVKKPWITYSLIVINIIMWAIIRLLAIRQGVSYSSLLEPFGAKVNLLLLQGEYWRFLSPMFLHGNEIHLVVNCYSLFILGSQVERLFGRWNFLLIYFIAGLVGNIASFSFSQSNAVGASGAIFGLLGALLFFSIRRPALLKSGFGANLVVTVVINLAYGYMNKQIDNNAHLGGLVGGLLVTGAAYKTKLKSSKESLLRVLYVAITIAVIVGGLFFGFNNRNNKAVAMAAELSNMDSQGNWTQIEKLGKDILEIDPRDESIRANVLWILTKAELNLGKFNEGIEHASMLVDISPPDGHMLLGVLYYSAGQYERATQHLEKARDEGSPNTEQISNILEEIRTKTIE